VVSAGRDIASVPDGERWFGRARAEGQSACDARLQGLVVAAAPVATVAVPACLYRESVAVDKPVTFEAAGAE
jgi:hypothetical protein